MIISDKQSTTLEGRTIAQPNEDMPPTSTPKRTERRIAHGILDFLVGLPLFATAHSIGAGICAGELLMTRCTPRWRAMTLFRMRRSTPPGR